MVNNKLNIIFLFLLISMAAKAQTSLDKLLESVLENNTAIQSYSYSNKANKLDARVGNTPNNPQIEYGYYPGNSNAIGTKTVFSVSQNFNFPTTYVYKQKVSLQKQNLADETFRSLAQNILQKAWECWATAIYYNKKKVVLDEREQQAIKMVDFYNKKQKSGDATQLEVNKAQLFLLEIQNQVRLHNGLMEQNNEELRYLSKGTIAQIGDTSFQISRLESWEVLAQKLDTLHPDIQHTQHESYLAGEQVKLSKSNWLPELMVGFESEDITGEKYSGVKAGITIPLWQQKNTVSASKAESLYKQSALNDTREKVIMQYKKRYLQTSTLRNNLNAFNSGISQMNNDHLLARSLELGQISAIEYFMELHYFYDITDDLLKLELEYQTSLAKLYDFTLL